MSALVPVAPGLWTEEAEPRLIGGRRQDGEIIFPVPDGDAASLVEPVALSRKGTLWSWTTQGFEPKEPYSGPQPFQPFLIGYVELPGEIKSLNVSNAAALALHIARRAIKRS